MKLLSVVCSLAVMLMMGCWHSKPRVVVTDAQLTERCSKLKLACELEYKRLHSGSHYWMGIAHTNRPWPEHDDWWFSSEDTREESVSELYEELEGPPTHPADPLPEVLTTAPKVMQ